MSRRCGRADGAEAWITGSSNRSTLVAVFGGRQQVQNSGLQNDITARYTPFGSEVPTKDSRNTRFPVKRALTSVFLEQRCKIRNWHLDDLIPQIHQLTERIKLQINVRSNVGLDALGDC